MFSVTVVDALRPAELVAVPVTTCPAPSVVVRTACGHVTVPDAVLQENETSTSVLFQPTAFAAGAAVAMMTGGVGGGELTVMPAAEPDASKYTRNPTALL